MAMILVNTLTNQISCIYWLIPDCTPPPLNFYEAPLFVPHIGWTPLTDTTDRDIRTNERTGGQSVRPFVS